MNRLRQNWKVYMMEAICLGMFMVSACTFATILEYPNSAVRSLFTNDFFRLCLMGLAMGVTAMIIIYSPMGRLSGAHMNPAVTLTFLGLGKIRFSDALFYLFFQLAGGVIAVVLMSFILGDLIADTHVNYVVTSPGKPGVAAAFIVECVMSFGMMIMVLVTSNHAKVSKYTGAIAGVLVMVCVVISAPISGFSINPARTIASAVPSGMYPAFWIYMTAPFFGMFSAGAIYKAFGGHAICAKMNHVDRYLCIFNCSFCKHRSTGDRRQSTA